MNTDLLRAVEEIEVELNLIREELTKPSPERQETQQQPTATLYNISHNPEDSVVVDPDVSAVVVNSMARLAVVGNEDSMDDQAKSTEPFYDREESFDYQSFRNYVNNTLKEYKY